MADLLVIVPSRGRPESVRRVVDAWLATGAFQDARLVFAVDGDDPAGRGYYGAEVRPTGEVDGWATFEPTGVGIVSQAAWTPMVPKLNRCAMFAAGNSPSYYALAFMGDDHLPRTPGWAGRYLAELRRLGTGIVYSDDRVQGERLPTQWAMTADIVRALGRMVPADVEHLYCDNSILDLGQGAGCISYLPDVVIEHCHPVAGRGVWDRGYERVNSRQQYARDHAAYQQWRADRMAADVATVRALREPAPVGGA